MREVTKTNNQAQQIAENRDCGRNDPRENPQTQGNSDPGTDGHPVALVHTVCAAEDAYVDVFESDVAVDHAGNDDLEFQLVLVLIYKVCKGLL